MPVQTFAGDYQVGLSAGRQEHGDRKTSREIPTMKDGYLLELTDEGKTIPPEVRLRQVLKRLLRDYGFRCDSVRPVQSHRGPADKVGAVPPMVALTGRMKAR